LAEDSVALRNCRYVSSSGIKRGSILIENGVIRSIKAGSVKAERTVDCEGKVVIPGAVDAHVHVYSPGWLEDNFSTGTSSAAAGGVTTILDMPSEDPNPTNNVQSFLEKQRMAEKDAIVNFGLYGGEIRTEADVAQISALSKVGAIGFKLIMGGPGFVDNDGVLYSAFEEIGKANSIAVVHAENAALVTLFRSRLMSKRHDASAFLDARPQIIEEEALERCISFARSAGNRVHIAHLPSKRGLEMVARAKNEHLSVTVETCPHYLLLSRKDYERYGHLMIVTPPIRELADQKALWQGLSSELINILATDHCAYRRTVKDRGKDSVWDTPGGLPGLETLLPLMLTYGVAKGKLSLELLTRLVSERPAKIFGLYPRKGVIRTGADADLTLLDLKSRYRFRADSMRSIGDFSPFDGWEMRGKPVMTVVNGSIVMENGEVFDDEKAGRFIRRSARNPHSQ
jgi:allantoinase